MSSSQDYLNPYRQGLMGQAYQPDPYSQANIQLPVFGPMFQIALKPLGDGIVYRSDDGGRTWVPQPDHPASEAA